jgi:tryptophan synthase beta chain
MGPHPYPWMVREFQRVIGDEAREQCRKILGGDDPDVVVACAGGGSNAAGIFAGFADATSSALVAVEAAGGAAMTTGMPGVLHGMRSALMQSEVGPEHAYLGELGRARYQSAGDEQVLDAFQRLARTEGIIPALESAHAIAWVIATAGTGELPTGSTVLVNLSGRGDKDVAQVRDVLRGRG